MRLRMIPLLLLFALAGCLDDDPLPFPDIQPPTQPASDPPPKRPGPPRVDTGAPVEDAAADRAAEAAPSAQGAAGVPEGVADGQPIGHGDQRVTASKGGALSTGEVAGRLRHRAQRLPGLKVALEDPEPCSGWPPKKGQKMGLTAEALAHIEVLKENLDAIKLVTTALDTGARIEARSDNNKVAAALQAHVVEMSRWLRVDPPLASSVPHPIYREMVKEAEGIHLLFDLPEDGVRTEESASDPEIIALIHAHAALLAAYLTGGEAQVDACQGYRETAP